MADKNRVPMYNIGKQVNLPDNIMLSDCMFKTKLQYKLPDNIKDTYYKAEQPKFTESKHAMSCRETTMDAVCQRQKQILQKLNTIKDRLENLKNAPVKMSSVRNTSLSIEAKSLKSGPITDMVISACPSNPPYFLLPIKKMLSSQFKIFSSSSVHSSVSSVDSSTQRLFSDDNPKSRSEYDVAFTVLWKEQPTKSLMIDPLTQTIICGESNILRYFARLFPHVPNLSYEQGARTPDQVSETDYWLDYLQTRLLHGGNKERQNVLKMMNSKLGNAAWLDLDGSQCYGLVDLFGWSAIKQIGIAESLPSNVASWFERIEKEFGFNNDSLSQRDNIVESKSNVSTKDTTPDKQDIPEGIDRKGLESMLRTNGIKFQVKDHEPVFTVEALMNCVSGMSGIHMKNLFLKDKKKNLYLLCARHDVQIKLNDIATKIGTKELRFGDEALLKETLGVVKGCVTIFALLNDADRKITLLLDSEAFNATQPYVNFHPMTNAATLGVTPYDLKKFLHLTGHKIELLHF